MRQTESLSATGGLRTVSNQPRAGFLVPGEPSHLLKFKLQLVGERFEMMRVVAGVGFHLFGERTPRPIGFLRGLVQFHAEKFFHERTQAKMPFAQKPRRQHGVENGARDKLVMLAQQPQIVIRAVHDEVVFVERGEERIEVHGRERINQPVAGHRADLNQANLFGVGVQAVSFGVERQPGRGFERGQESGKLCVGVNHA